MQREFQLLAFSVAITAVPLPTAIAQTDQPDNDIAPAVVELTKPPSSQDQPTLAPPMPAIPTDFDNARTVSASGDEELPPNATKAIVDLQSEGELIRQRFPDGGLQIERRVKENAAGDLVNHGPFREYDGEGNLLVSGQYVEGQPIGRWTRAVSQDELARIHDQTEHFAAPFESSVNFVQGRANGHWTINDAEQRSVVELAVENGSLHGDCQWFRADGSVLRKLAYENNLVHGSVQWTLADGSPVELTALDGKLPTCIEKHYPAGENGEQLKSHAWFLKPCEFNVAELDWHQTKLSFANQTVANAEPTTQQMMRHGRTITFYPDGKRESEGNYEFGRRHGTFVWWFANGQQKAVGEYQNDAEHGPWTWWHDNGMKAATGSFSDGLKTELWSVWARSGKLVERRQAQAAKLADSSEPIHRN